MSIRPIEPIDISGLTPNVPPTGTPIFEDVDPKALFVDPAYQRNLSEKSMRQIRRIVQGFDWTKFKPPVCAMSIDEDGRSILKVIDGQHTAIAAASNPAIQTIPIMIVDAPDTQSQASAFMGQNLDRLGVTAPQMHVAALTAGEPEAIEMQTLCEEVGITICRQPPARSAYRPGETISIAAIRFLIKEEGTEHARLVLDLLARSALAPIRADHIKAMNLLLTDPEFGSVDPNGLAASIGGHHTAIKEAKAFSATHGVTLWRALAAVWFKSARKRRRSDGSAVPQRLQCTIQPEELAHDDRPTRGDWSPGNQVSRCSRCDVRFRGGPTATTCADCAYENAEAA